MTDRHEESGKEFLEFLGYSDSTGNRNNESTSSNVDLEAPATSSSSRRDRRSSRSNSRPSQGSSSRIGGGSMSKLKKTRKAGTRSSSPGPPLTRLSGTSGSGSGSSSKRGSSPMMRTASYSPSQSMSTSNILDETQAQQEYRRRRQQSTSSSSEGNNSPHIKGGGKSPTRRTTSAAPASTSTVSSSPKSGNLGSPMAAGSGYVTSTSTTTTPPRRARNRMSTTKSNSPPTPPTANTAAAADIDQSDHSIHLEGDRFVRRCGQDIYSSEEFHDEIPALKSSKSKASSKSMGSRSMSGGGGSSRRRRYDNDDEEEGMNEDIQYLNTMISGFAVKKQDHHNSDSAIPDGRRRDGLRQSSILDSMRNLYSSSFPARSTLITRTAAQQPEKMPGSTTSQAGLLNASRSSLDAFEIMKSVGAASLGNVELDTSERTNTPRYSTTTPATNTRGSFGIANRFSWNSDSNKSVKKRTKLRWLTIVCLVLAVALLMTIGALLAIYGQDLFSKNATPANGSSGGTVISESDAGHSQETITPTTPAPVIATDAPITAAPQDDTKTLDFSKVPQTSRHDAVEFWILDQGLSNPDDLSSTATEPSAATRALFWLIEDDSANLTIPGFGTTRRNLSPADHKEADVMLRVLLQRYALVVFYISQEEGLAVADNEVESSGTATDATRSTEQERRQRMQMDAHWATALPTCEWPGVTCNEDKMVVALNLTSCLLKGTIPPEIFAGGALPALTSLDLSHNRLHGDLPVTFVANSGESATGLDPTPLPLQELRLNDNQIQGGLEGLQGLEQLTLLDLSENNLGGSIPATISAFPTLSSLILDFNHLDGTLTTDLGKLTALETLSIKKNKLSGPIPNAWWTLSHLKILDLSYNEGINGIIPNFLGTKVKDLRVVDFRETNLEGSIPDLLEHLSNLEAMYLHRTNLVGHMPDGVCVLRAPLGHLRELTSDCASAKEGGTVKCICCTECFW